MDKSPEPRTTLQTQESFDLAEALGRSSSAQQNPEMLEATVGSEVVRVSFKDIVHRMVVKAKYDDRHHGNPLWAAVQEVTSFGATYSVAVCKYFGEDPDAPIYIEEADVRCPRCNREYGE